jgi:hypothetical protein
MDPRNLIVSRIDLQLRRHLGQPVDAHRAVTDARYARDLLLVCDAMADTDLPQLAAEFRDADERTSAARRALAPRPNTRVPLHQPPPSELAATPQRPVSFNRAR